MISTGFVLVPALEERLFKLRLGVEWGHFTLGVSAPAFAHVDRSPSLCHGRNSSSKRRGGLD
jgi:hypothetical protein